MYPSVVTKMHLDTTPGLTPNQESLFTKMIRYRYFSDEKKKISLPHRTWVGNNWAAQFFTTLDTLTFGNYKLAQLQEY